jgi:hypothetical protein
MGAQEPPVFGAAVGLVEVDVFVASRDAPVMDLTAEDFEVRDNGVRQEARLVSLDTVGVTATLVIDTSARRDPRPSPASGPRRRPRADPPRSGCHPELLA